MLIAPVTGDRVQLQQVILNLLLNASEAMSGVDDRPRELVIRTERDENDRVRLTVDDSGVGLEPGMVDKLFEWPATSEGSGSTFSFSIPCGSEGVAGAEALGAIQIAAAPMARVMGNS